MHTVTTKEQNTSPLDAAWAFEYLDKLGFKVEGDLAYAPSSKALAGTSIGSANNAIEGAAKAALDLSINGPEFMDLILAPIWKMDSSAVLGYLEVLHEVETMTEYDGAPVSQEFKHHAVQTTTLSVACAYAVKSLKLEANSCAAWEAACQANYWIGLLHGSLVGKAMGVNVGKSALGKAGADARHAENRQMKQYIFDWCDKNMQNFKSMDKAAESIHGKVVPMGFRTIREWIGEWKKIRSTGKL